MPTTILGIIAVTLLIGCSFKIGEAIGACIGDQIKYRYVLWRDKRGQKNASQ